MNATLAPSRRHLRWALPAAITLALAIGALGIGVSGADATEPAPVCESGYCTITFAFTGESQEWTVPSGVTSATFTLDGAQGGSSELGPYKTVGGLGAKLVASFALHPLESIGVEVAGAGEPLTAGYGGGGEGGTGFEGLGGGGGGASVITVSGQRVLVAGGGGGAGSYGNSEFGGGTGGVGGAEAGGMGVEGSSRNGWGGDGGEGGTQSQPGAGGPGGLGSPTGVGASGASGGSGASNFLPFAGGGGGGGGGYFGGGGGGAGYTESAGGGGGGGSSYAPVSSVASVVPGVREGNGEVTISYIAPPALTLASSTVAFTGAQPLQTLSSPIPVTITDTGEGPLQITGTSFVGADPQDFLVGASTCGGQLAPGASCEVELWFAPQGSGTREATLKIASNAPSSPTEVTLTGVGGPVSTGSTGSTGPAGPEGAAGAAGPTGAQGPAGSPGQAGSAVLISCVKSIGGQGKSTQTCKVQNGSAPFKVQGAGNKLAAVLRRGGRIYATGFTLASKTGTSLVLTPRRTLKRGRYQLVVKRGGRHISTTVWIR